MIRQLIQDAAPNTYVHIPKGNYEINEPILIDKPLEILGDKPYIFTTKDIPIFKIVGPYKVEFSGLEIDAQQPKSVGIHYDGGLTTDTVYEGLSVELCTLKGNGTGIILKNARESNIDKCTFFSAGTGIYAKNATNPRINRNLFTAWSLDATAIFIDGVPDIGYSCGARILDNTIIGFEYGIKMEGNDYGDISHNMIDYCGTPIQIKSQDQLLIAQNYIGANGRNGVAKGIEVCKYSGYYNQHIKILGNTIVTYPQEATERTGISAACCNGLTIKDNTIHFYNVLDITTTKCSPIVQKDNISMPG